MFLCSLAIAFIAAAISRIAAPPDSEDSDSGSNTAAVHTETKILKSAQTQAYAPEDEDEDKEDYTYIGSEVSVGYFSYIVNEIEYVNSVEDEDFGEVTADGIFLVINLSIKNTSK